MHLLVASGRCMRRHRVPGDCMSRYKLYLHIEESQTFPEFTFIYKSNRDSQHTVREVIEEFRSAYAHKHGKDISKESLQLVSESGKHVHCNTAVVKAFGSGDDVQVRVAKRDCPIICPPAAEQQTGSPPTRHGLEHLVADLQIGSNSGTPPQALAYQAQCESSGTHLPPCCNANELIDQQDGKVYLPIIKQFLERAKEAESKKYFRAACKIYKQVLNNVVPHQRIRLGYISGGVNAQILKVAPSHKEALTAFAQLWLTVSRPQDAVRVAKKAADSAPDDPNMHRLYAECLR